MSDRAETTAVGAGLLFGECLGLPLEEDGQSALGQAGGGGGGELLHGGELEAFAGAGFIAEGSAGDDIAPAGGQLADLL
jgi:hypothetical protein